MDLVFYGVNHFNPAHRGLVRHFLEVERVARAEPPALVAVEWDATQFLHVALFQRPQFRIDLVNQWGFLQPAQVDTLEAALGFEGDSHVDLFPRSQTVWLGDGDPRDITTYAQGRINLFNAYLQVYPAAADGHDFIDCLSRRCRELDVPDAVHKRERDVKFAFRLHPRALEIHGGWGAVIVGWDHALDQTGSMYRLTRLLGHNPGPVPYIFRAQ